ncbi:MAG: hypothetical protein JW784_02230 [Candidatus Cloacimonetes bacterium]|nr:hypothetical protein [Candidatus Cloacimonadota bacterium]
MKQFYFKINLNKYGELRRKIQKDKITFRNTVLVFVIGTIILYVFVLYLNSFLDKRINTRTELLSQIRQEIQSYQVSGDYLSSKDLQRLAKISTERIFWARKLVALSEQTTDKIAITHFSFKNNVLSLFGITKLDKDEKEFDLIDDFIANLKANEQISIDFPDIKLVRSRRDFEKEVEILRFQIDCIAIEFKDKEELL